MKSCPRGGLQNKGEIQMKKRILIALVLLIAGANLASAQTTEFTYQGKLNDGSLPANANYDFEFRLFDVASGGTAIVVQQRLGVAVTNGIFTVSLDFGSDGFRSSPRFLEILVKPAGSPNPFLDLSPRQPITSAPYSIRSLNSTTADTATDSTQLGGIAANQYVQTTDTRLSDDRNPLPNSPNYIQNTNSPQASSNFNVSGTGTANILNAATQYNISGNRIFSVGGFQNVFAGVNSGAANTTGDSNAFFGYTAGQVNSTTRANSFFGANAGRNNIANDNAFFGTSAGLNNTTGPGNTFLGRSAGLSNTTESNNTFIGFNSNGAAGITNATAIGANAVVTTSNTMVLGTRAVAVQVPGSLNIAGSFGANILNAATQFNIGGTRVLSIAGNLNTFAGVSAGSSNTTGQNNAFFGTNAGDANTTGGSNSFFGYKAGQATTTQSENSFFGVNAGRNNTVDGNSFFGVNAGFNNTTGASNAFFGLNAGQANTTGGLNSFYGVSTGLHNSTGTFNSFFGTNAGQQNTSGNYNTFVGISAGSGNHTGDNNSFFGALAGFSNEGSKNSFFGYFAGLENTIGVDNSFFGFQAGKANTEGYLNSFLGSHSGESNTTGSANSFFGTSAGHDNTTGGSNSFFGGGAGFYNTEGQYNTFVGQVAGFANTTASSNSYFGFQAGYSATGHTVVGWGANVGFDNLNYATAIGSGVVVTASNTIALGRIADQVITGGKLIVSDDLTVIHNLNLVGLGSAGSTDLCRNGSNQISTCSSSLRYKSNVRPFVGGLDIVRHLRPITFNWKDGGMHDVGFGAEEVEKIEPLLTTRNDKGEIEGVKYGQLTSVLVNAVNQQQEIINAQQRRVEEQEKLFKQQEERIKSQERCLAAQQKTLERQQRELERLKNRFFASRPAGSRRLTRHR
jgi:hypothetical protein